MVDGINAQGNSMTNPVQSALNQAMNSLHTGLNSPVVKGVFSATMTDTLSAVANMHGAGFENSDAIYGGLSASAPISTSPAANFTGSAPYNGIATVPLDTNIRGSKAQGIGG